MCSALLENLDPYLLTTSVFETYNILSRSQMRSQGCSPGPDPAMLIRCVGTVAPHSFRPLLCTVVDIIGAVQATEVPLAARLKF
jgi:hypothetical protein